MILRVNTGALGKEGVEYVRGLSEDRVFSIVENLLILNEKELISIRANVEALAEAKKRSKATRTDGRPG